MDLTDRLDGYPVDAPRLRRPVLLDQRWADVAFLHWPVDPQAVAPLFPAGTRPDVLDGVTWVGLVPFRMAGAGFGTTPAVPYFGSFLETNVRLYSVDDAGRHGVLFRSLETERLAVVPFARLVFGTAYTWARMSSRHRGDVVEYESVRLWPHRGLRSRVAVRVGDEVAPGPLEVWLTARWGLHTRRLGRTWWVPNHHDAWPLHRAHVVDLEDDLLAASGVPGVDAGEPPASVLWSPGVSTRFGRPTRVA